MSESYAIPLLASSIEENWDVHHALSAELKDDIQACYLTIVDLLALLRIEVRMNSHFLKVEESDRVKAMGLILTLARERD